MNTHLHHCGPKLYRWGRSIINNLLASLFLLLFSFVLLHSLPGNQADVLLNRDIGPAVSLADYQYTRHQLGLDQSLLWQFGHWLKQVCQGDLGYSIVNAAPVWNLIRSALPWTLALVSLSIPLSLLLGGLVGLIAGMTDLHRSGQWLLTLMTALSSLPGFVIAFLLLALLGFQLDWFPTHGGESLLAGVTHRPQLTDRLWHGVLPLLALTLHACVHYFYLAYGLAQQIRNRPFIQSAQLRGIHGIRLLWRWYLPNAMPELLSRLSSSLPGTLGATILVEVVFAYPGIGNLMLATIQSRDYVLLQGIVLVTGLLVLFGNTLLDLISTALTDRG